MKRKMLLDSIESERSLRLKGRTEFDSHAVLLWNKALSLTIDIKRREKLLDAYKFAYEIEYDHVGLSSEIYFAHPLRVASLAMLYYDEINVDLGIVGLIHNIYELSDYTKEVIGEKFGKNISDQITNLTVNRDFQWDEDYKTDYYKTIANGPIESRIVKIIDKLDNLFILGINPNREVKLKYLNEIEKYVLPLARKATPEIYSYMKELVESTYNAGFNLVENTNHE